MKKYVLGIDAGGTKYRVLALDMQGNRLASHTGPTASHYRLTPEEMAARINVAIDACLQGFGGRREGCAYILCGSTGIDSEEDAAFVSGTYASLPGFACPAECINDVELAHWAVTGGRGALVISGTGSIAYGRTATGETARVGGWLFSIMGDEGSGNWMARHALRHLGRWFDGTVPQDGPLALSLCNALSIHTRKQLMDEAVRIATPPWAEPKLGSIVDRAAEEGDPYAVELLQAAAKETFGLVSSLIKLLGLEAEGEYPVGIWGSNILQSPTHRAHFAQLLKEAHPGAQLTLPKRDAIQAAAALALEKAGGVVDVV